MDRHCNILRFAYSAIVCVLALSPCSAQAEPIEESVLVQRLRSSVIVAEQDRISFAFLAEKTAEPAAPENTSIPMAIGSVSLLELEPEDEWRHHPHYLEFTQGLRPVQDYNDNRGLRPREIAVLLRNEYGAGSVVARSALTLAAVADAAERGSQMSLDQVNDVTARLVSETGDLMGWGKIPVLRLRSVIQTDKVMVGIKSRW